MTHDHQNDEGMRERQHFLEGMTLLEAGELTQAIKAFRQAARLDHPPWQAHAQVALGQCHMAQGKEGAAMRSWLAVAKDPQAEPAARWMATLCLRARYEARGEGQKAAEAGATSGQD